jgi:hypothetical protein
MLIGWSFEVEPYPAFMRRHGRGRCVNCGYLAKMMVDFSHAEQYWDIERATLRNRQVGDLFTCKAGQVDAVPVCYVAAADLAAEVEAQLLGKPRTAVDWLETQAAAARSVTTKHRRCRRWTAWHQHRPPDWHLDRVRTEVLEHQSRRLALSLGLAALVLALAQVAIGLTPESYLARALRLPGATPIEWGVPGTPAESP